MKDLIQEQLLHAGEAGSVTPEQLKVDGFRLTSQTLVEEEQFLFRHFVKPCFPRKELTTVTGPAKSGKTFFTSMVMACCVERQVMSLERIREEPLRVMWYDTEQSRNTTKEILVQRIGRMIAHEGQEEQPSDGSPQVSVLDRQFYVFNVRSASIKERREMLGVALATYQPDIVFLDGISDLLIDINDGPKATELMEELMRMADEFNCNITTLIHLNRTGEKSNLRGWLGTLMLQKSFEVFNCASIAQTETFSVEVTVSRKYRNPQTLYYEIDQEGIPYSTQKPDLQPRDAQGKFMSKTSENPEDTLNHDYIIDQPENVEMPWDWDYRRLFTDAMGKLSSMGNEQMMQAVMKLSRIKKYQYYYKVLAEAEKRGVIVKTFDRYKRVAIVLSPQR